MILCLNILAIISILVIVCLSIVLIISYYENRKLTVTEYHIKDRLCPVSFDGFRIVHLSDLHNAEFGDKNKNLFEVIKKQNPDIIVITGDMIIGKPNMDVTMAVDFVNSLCEIAPVYYSMGNHELRVSLYEDTYGDMWQQFMNRISPDINLLFDKQTTILRNNDSIQLYGLNMTSELYKRIVKTPMQKEYLTSLFGLCDHDKYHIFLAHNPDYFEDYTAWGANLTFSGHVHGGMIRIPWIGGALSPMIHFFPKYDKGLFENDNKYMILSGGLGNHTFKFRVNNLPEVITVTLHTDNTK